MGPVRSNPSQPTRKIQAAPLTSGLARGQRGGGAQARLGFWATRVHGLEVGDEDFGSVGILEVRLWTTSLSRIASEEADAMGCPVAVILALLKLGSWLRCSKGFPLFQFNANAFRPWVAELLLSWRPP